MDQLRAERARFESELAAGGSPGVIPETPLGEGGHVPTAAVETTRIDDAPGRNDDSVWDSDEDERPTNPGGAAKTPMPSELLARGASMRARARDDTSTARNEEDEADTSTELLPEVGEDLVASIRGALDDVERGLRASVAASSQMRALHAKRGTGEAIAAPTPGTTGAPSPVTPVIGAALMTALGDLGGDGKNEDPEAKAYLKGVLRMLYDGDDDETVGNTAVGGDSATPTAPDGTQHQHVEGADLAPVTMTPLIERATAVRVDEWHRLRDDPDRESVVARYVAHSPLYVGAGGGSNLPPTPGLPPTPAAVEGMNVHEELGQTSKDGSNDGVEFNSDVLASVNPPSTTRLAVTVDDDDGFAFNAMSVPFEGKMSYKSMRAASVKNNMHATDDGIDATAVPSMLDELRNLKARFHEQQTDAAKTDAPKTTTNANDSEQRFKGGWDDDVSADLSPLPDPTDMIRDLSPEVSFRDDDDVSDEETNADDRSRMIASYGQTVMTPSTGMAFEGTPTSKPRGGSSIPFATPRSPGGDGGTATMFNKVQQRSTPKSPVGPLELAPSPPPSGSKQKNTPAPRSPSRTRNDTGGQIRNDTTQQIKPQVREALVALDPIAGANVPGQPAWSVAMSAQVRAAHARKKEAKSKVEDLLGGGFDYDALRCMAKSAHDTLKGNTTHGLPDGGRSSYLPKPSGGGGGQIFAAGAKASRLTRANTQGPFDRGSVYAPPNRTSAHVTHHDDEAAYFEDAVLNPALELDPDATIEGFKAAISAEISARIAASKSAVKAEATQLYKANVVGSNLAWRKNNDSYQTNSAYTDAGFTHEPHTEFTVGGSGRSGRGQKQPAFGATEGHYDPSGRVSRRVSGRTRTVSVDHAHEQHVARGGDHGHTDRRFVKGKWAPPRAPARAKSAPPTRPSAPNLRTDRHRRGTNTPKASHPSMSGHFSDGESADEGAEGADGITDTVRKASATRRAAASALAKRREERMDRAAKTRAALELRRNAEVEAALAEAESKRAHAAEEARRRKAPVAFGGRTDKLPPKAGAADEDGKKLPRDKDGKLIPRPFKLSETKPRHRNPFDDDDENKAPARDPDVWESREEEAARLEREKIEKAAATQKRRELAEKAHKYGTESARKENRIGADPKRRSLQDTFAEAHHRRDVEIEHNAERRRSRETLRQSAVVAAAAQVAAPAIAAAEAAQRNASAAASAAAKAAQAAAAAEALMMNEAQRLREQRKRLFSREGGGREGGRHPISVGASFNSRFDASADDDDAVPLMASLEGDDLHAGSLLYRTERVAATAAAAAQAAAKEADFPVPSKSPAPTTDGDGITTDFDAPQVRVSSSLATPSPIKVAGTSPSPLREAVTSRLGGAEIKEAARDVKDEGNKNAEDEEVVRDGGSMFESVEEDANALAAALPPLESADKVAKTSKRVAERRKRNEKTSGAEKRVLAESVVTPPSPRSPAVAWRVGARELPGPLRQPVFASSKAAPEALTNVEQPVKNAESKDDESHGHRQHQSVAAKKAAEARANAMAELASVQLPNDTSRSSHDVSMTSATDDKSREDGESRAPAAPKFLRGGDLYDYVGPKRLMPSQSMESSAFDPESGEDDDDSDDETWLRRGSADSSEFERTTGLNTSAGTTHSDKADLSLTRSATAAIAREMHHGKTSDVSQFYVRHSHPEGRAALAAALAREDAEISDVESVESLE